MFSFVVVVSIFFTFLLFPHGIEKKTKKEREGKKKKEENVEESDGIAMI